MHIICYEEVSISFMAIDAKGELEGDEHFWLVKWAAKYPLNSLFIALKKPIPYLKN
jgi:hypothetical protein